MGEAGVRRPGMGGSRNQRWLASWTGVEDPSEECRKPDSCGSPSSTAYGSLTWPGPCSVRRRERHRRAPQQPRRPSASAGALGLAGAPGHAGSCGSVAAPACRAGNGALPQARAGGDQRAIAYREGGATRKDLPVDALGGATSRRLLRSMRCDVGATILDMPSESRSHLACASTAGLDQFVSRRTLYSGHCYAGVSVERT